MISHLDHITIVVRDVERAKEFFGLLGFEEDKNVTISGEKFEKYMNVAGIKAELPAWPAEWLGSFPAKGNGEG